MERARPIDELCINTIRTLSIDAVQKAHSGHPGAPMGMAPAMYVLWDRFMRHDPADPDFPNRDRFVLSMGHASMLLYSTLHLTGYDVTLEDLKDFRRVHGKCAGHPEFGLVPGVDTTTGPLGQGAGNSVGMAIAERWLADHFNRPGHTIVDYTVYAFCSDGDLMEGLGSEAASIAGHLGLSNLIWFYDSNRITIDGPTEIAFSEDVRARFLAYRWRVHQVRDANNVDEIHVAIEAARAEADRPSLIIVDSHIGYGSPNRQDTAKAHGEPLGEDEVRLATQNYGWDPDR
ncbi:MAG: transketolase, partial [Planctomycetes bacterium]|nr:transketolase [Planctomycetota bacterium]